MPYELTYANQGKTRSLPLSAEVARAYELAAQAAGIDEIRVTSGGQESSGPNRTGSHRHDAGGAGDIQLVKDGRVLDFTKPEDLPYFSKFVSAGHGSGLTGFGAGTDYMGNTTIHAGMGSPVVWGAGGASANAPDWLKSAYGTTINSTPVTTAAPVAEKPEETPYESALSSLGEVIKAANGKAPKEEQPAQMQQSAPTIQPNTPNPQMAQSIMAQLLNRNKPNSLMAGLGIQ